MKKIQILIVDNDLHELTKLFEALEDSILNGQFELMKCSSVGELPVKLMGKYGGGVETIDSLKSQGNSLDIALLDRIFDEEFGEDPNEGPYRSVIEIRKFSPKCKFLLLTRLGAKVGDCDARIYGREELRFPTISKFETDVALSVILEIVKEWTIDWLLNEINHGNQMEIVKCLKKDQNLPVISSSRGTWSPQTYLIPYYFHLQNDQLGVHDPAGMSKLEVIALLESKYCPKLKAWTDKTDNYAYPLKSYYQAYLKFPNRNTQLLNREAENYIREYQDAERSGSTIQPNDFSFKGDIDSPPDDYRFVDKFENILIGRRISLGMHFLGYSPIAIWHALRKDPKVYSQLDGEEKKQAYPNQLFSTYFALSLTRDVPKSMQEKGFDELENLLAEEIEWLNSYFSVSPKILLTLEQVIVDIQYELKPYSNDQDVQRKFSIKTIDDAVTLISKLIRLSDQFDLGEKIKEAVKDELISLKNEKVNKKILKMLS